MDRTQVESSNLAAVGYNAERYLLEVEFRDGAIYRYSRVPTHIYLGLLNATSKGGYFHQYIVNRYPTTKVSGPTNAGTL